jgi:DNA-binding NarL/FixJ family response regulator
MIAPNAEVHASQSEEPRDGASAAVGGEPSPSGPSLAKPDRSLHPSAVKADMTATTEVPLALLWRELTRGVSKIVDGFFHGDRCYLLVAKRAQPTPELEGKRLEILEAVLSGQRQKNIAIDRGLAPSTVALNSRLALEALGVSNRPSRAHPLLMLAARAASLQLSTTAKCTSILSDHNRELRVISVLRPDLALSQVLPSAELSVIRNLVEGACYRDIARARGTSTRTIANQISMVFRRLRVSGRNELVQRLFVEGALGPASKPSPEPPTRPPGLAMRKSA